MIQDLPVPEPQPGDVRETADQILSRAEFNQSESIVDRLSRWLSEALGEVVGALSGSGAGSIMAWLLLLAVVAVGAFLISRLRRPVGYVKRVGDEVNIVTQAGAPPEAKTPEQWALLARRLAEEGKYDEALRARYRCLLAGLVHRGLLEDIAGRTPGEYRSDLATSHAEAAPHFGALTERFEQVWYSPARATAADLDQFGDHESHVWRALAEIEAGASS